MRGPEGMWWKLAVGFLLLLAGRLQAQVTTTTVQGTVYRADGTPASGSVLVSWPAFITAANQAVAAGSTTGQVGLDGFLSLQLAPNAGASPAGSYYTVVYHLSDGTVSKEYWAIPVAASATIASVRAQLEPSTVAVQSVSKSYVDNLVSSIAPTAQNYLPLAGGVMNGPLTLSTDPSSTTQATTKHYVDQAVATALPLGGGTITGTLAAANAIEKLPRVDVRSLDFAGGADPTGVRDSTSAIQAAIAFVVANSPTIGATYPALYFAPGLYKVQGTLRIPSSMHMVSDSKDGAVLQETDPTASLITVYPIGNCRTYVCYGGIEHLTLAGSGKLTQGTLLELNSGFFTLRDIHFFNNGGRGLQMNAATERVQSFDLSFYQVRWPLIMAGDSNEDYFYNTHVIEAGQTQDAGSGQGAVGRYCYSVNCVNGSYALQGTTANPTTILPDPHGSIDIDKAVNVSFVGGSVKSTNMLSGVRVWAGTVVRFQNFYHEDPDFGLPAMNRAYIIGGKAETTYLTAALPATGTSVAVHDVSWMPQVFGSATDVDLDDGDSYAYLLLPQDYDRTSSAPSAYVSGLNKNQFELVNIEGFTQDGVLHIQQRHSNGNAPAGIVWPAGTIVEELAPNNASVELDAVHLNQVQGLPTENGWQVACDATTYNACGEIVVGFSPDVQNLTSDPTTNSVEYYTPLQDPYDPANGLTASLTMRGMDMYSSASNPATGMIVAEHRAVMQIDGSMNPEHVESVAATVLQQTGQQVDISGTTGGSKLFAPLYASGATAAVTLTIPSGEILWDSARQVFHKHTSLFEPNQQFGRYMNGLQYQSLYCQFDTPTTDGGHVLNRFCQGGGPGNVGGAGTGYGGGIEYDNWGPSGWVDMFKVWGQNGVGTLTASVPTALGSTLNVVGATNLGGTLTTSGAASFASAVGVSGALSASLMNGNITVDGTKYTTLNAAWTAAIAAANSSGRNQTIWLGPGSFNVTATMAEPTNGACVGMIGSAGTTGGADIAGTATALNVSTNLNGDVFFLGNAALTEGCTFKDLNILAGKNATHGFEMEWARGLLLDSVTVNDTTGDAIVLGESTTSSGHQTSALLRNITVSYSSAAFTPATRPLYGLHLEKTLLDSMLNTVLVRNAQMASVWNEGTGNVGYAVHGFGFPYTCAAAPCSSTATSSTATNASYATNYVVYDTGGAGSTWTDTYADSPAISAFYVGANGVEIHGGHVQWPELTSFPSANLAQVSAAVTNNLLIADVSCLGMSSAVNWINYASTSGVPPTFASVHHLTGCGNYYQALEPATTTGFSGGGASNNAPANGAVAAVWAAPKAQAATFSAFSAQEYTGYQGDLFDGHIAGQMPFFNLTYQGTIRSAGGIALSTVINTASALALTTANKNVIANAASGGQVLTLPSCFTAMPDKAAPTGLELTIVKADTSGNAVTMQTLSGQTINYGGVTAQSLVMSAAGKRTLVCGPDNNWYAY